MNFITNHKKKLQIVAAALFWLIVWQLLAVRLSNSILLASPVATIKTLFSLMGDGVFWSTVLFSFTRIAGGFLLGAVCGVLLSVLSYNFKVIKILLSPLFSVITAIPVASFIILALVWFNSQTLSIFTSFIMVMPIVYMNCLKGMEETNKQLLEMAQVFEITLIRKVLYIYLPAVVPFFVSACGVSLGLAWKSGIAAEIISLPARSIGARLYEAKLYLATDELFSWTLVIVLLSIGFEKLFLLLIAQLEKIVGGGKAQ